MSHLPTLELGADNLRPVAWGVFLIALVTLMSELVLIRLFDVYLTPNLAYLVITCAMFAFGLAGVYSTVRPAPADARAHVAKLALLFAIAIALFIPVVNLLPFNNMGIFTGRRYILLWVPLYGALAAPFFCAGLIFTTIFSAYPGRVSRLYAWDLAGAGIGATILIPFLPQFGAGGLLFAGATLALFASALFSTNRLYGRAITSVAATALVVLLLLPPDTFEISVHLRTNALIEGARKAGTLEFTKWDIVSRIDVVDHGNNKRIAYDGNSQISYIYPFDGDLEKLRAELPTRYNSQFWQLACLAAHYLKRDTDQRVLIIGGGAGQETKAAVLFGAAQVDVVELVGTVIDLMKTKYAQYSGHIYNHPNVHARVGEGRSFLRSTDETYDIIQIYSNQTSASIASGNGAVATHYLQTSEAYEEYFRHLTDNGVLHINFRLYPRMVTTAAKAWKAMGRTDFQKHVLVFVRDTTGGDGQPSFMVKMKPWTREEIDSVFELLSLSTRYDYAQVEFPTDPERSFLAPAFYSGDDDVVAELDRLSPYRLRAATDDRPYFLHVRKEAKRLEPDPDTFVHDSVSNMLNSGLRGPRGAPMDVLHLYVVGAVSLLFAGIFLFVPLLFSGAGKADWPRRPATLTYFSCLGAGFIIYELVFIQIFIHFIGSPVYTYSTVIFSMLFSAGLGSFWSDRFASGGERRWMIPFGGILVTVVLLIFLHRPIFEALLGLPMPARVVISALMLAPAGFFLGMPFPVGIRLLEHRPRGAIAWAWALNGFFTVAGGLIATVLGLVVGFKLTLLAGLAVYGAGFASLGRMLRSQNSQ